MATVPSFVTKQCANHIIDQCFDKDAAAVVKSHARWAAFIIFFPLFGLDLIIYACILWHMYSSLCKLSRTNLGVGNFITGVIVNVVVAIVVDIALSFIPFVGWLGSSVVAYLQFTLSGKGFISMIKDNAA